MSNVYAVTFFSASTDTKIGQASNTKLVASGQTDQVLWEKWADSAQEAINLANQEISSCKVTGSGRWIIVAVNAENEEELDSLEISL